MLPRAGLSLIDHPHRLRWLAMAVDLQTRDLIGRIRRGDEAAWRECIDRYEGRLQAFAYSRIRDRAVAEDLVQETFVGFLTSLPNYDEQTPLESFLFAITAHKLTDHLRREGRRPTIPMIAGDSAQPGADLPGSARVASSLARSRERKVTEEAVLAKALSDLIASWKERGGWERLKVLELLFVRGWPNKEVASQLGLNEQTVANHKHFVVSKLKEAATLARVQAGVKEFE
ncbi:MAG: RNA polymerase sigma factor [Planctomycetaceae bacterium]